MTKRFVSIIMSAVALMAMTVSCEKNYYNPEKQEEMYEEYFPVDSVDKNHDWKTVKSATIKITSNKSTDYNYIIKIYGSNPYNSSTGKSATTTLTNYFEIQCNSKDTVESSLSYPLTTDKLYIVCDSAGYMVNVIEKSINSGQASHEVTIGESDMAVKEEYNEETFMWTYCFEDAFPSPSTSYDFNDIVLTVYKELNSDLKVVTLHVTLRAVGTLLPIAAAIHFSGLEKSDILWVDADQPFKFYQYGQYSKIHSTGDGYLDVSETIGGKIVIPLFNDAHYAIIYNSDTVSTTTTTGSVTTGYVNTVGSNSPSKLSGAGLTMPVVEGIYTIKCRSIEAAQAITANNLDVFITTMAVGATYEVHIPPFKAQQVLYQQVSSQYESAFYGDQYTWGLLVPGEFKYPQEDIAIGYEGNDSRFGAYTTTGHSFAEWAKDKDDATDWYEYPNGNVYIAK